MTAPLGVVDCGIAAEAPACLAGVPPSKVHPAIMQAGPHGQSELSLGGRPAGSAASAPCSLQITAVGAWDDATCETMARPENAACNAIA
jgi:hypothetical protein